MNYKKYIIFSFLIIFLSTSQITFAIDQDTISLEQFESYKKELGFDKTKKQIKPREFDLDLLPNSMENLDFLSGFFKVIGYILLAILVIVLIYFIANEVRIKNKINPSEIDLDNIEDIKSFDFETMLAETLQARDFRLAIRIKFLMVIKSLTEHDILDWKPYKTNRTYANELNKTEYKPAFLRLTNVFEHIWYGISSIEEEKYLQYVPYFDSFLNQIKK